MKKELLEKYKKEELVFRKLNTPLNDDSFMEGIVYSEENKVWYDKNITEDGRHRTWICFNSKYIWVEQKGFNIKFHNITKHMEDGTMESFYSTFNHNDLHKTELDVIKHLLPIIVEYQKNDFKDMKTYDYGGN